MTGGSKATISLSTVGVDVCDWEYGKKPIKFSTWDFAGQVNLFAVIMIMMITLCSYIITLKLCY